MWQTPGYGSKRLQQLGWRGYGGSCCLQVFSCPAEQPLEQKSSNASPVGDASLPRLIPCKNMARLINALESKP